MCPDVTGGFRQFAGGTHPSVVLRLMHHMWRNRSLSATPLRVPDVDVDLGESVVEQADQVIT